MECNPSQLPISEHERILFPWRAYPALHLMVTSVPGGFRGVSSRMCGMVLLFSSGQKVTEAEIWCWHYSRSIFIISTCRGAMSESIFPPFIFLHFRARTLIPLSPLTTGSFVGVGFLSYITFSTVYHKVITIHPVFTRIWNNKVVVLSRFSNDMMIKRFWCY